MPGIRVKENEPFEVAVRRFKRAIEKTGLLTELRAREFYEKPQCVGCRGGFYTVDCRLFSVQMYCRNTKSQVS